MMIPILIEISLHPPEHEYEVISNQRERHGFRLQILNSFCVILFKNGLL
jgi:hypothetical protein